MNCPGHCKLFAHSGVTYRNLPWRAADFGVLHRNEFSGALSGLTRVRRFAQDDAHIFCSTDQIGNEIEGVFDFLNRVYGLCGFKFKLKLSTRPDKFIGDVTIWDEAESKLKIALTDLPRLSAHRGKRSLEMAPFTVRKLTFSSPMLSTGSTNVARSSSTSIFHAGSNFPTWPRKRATSIPIRLAIVLRRTCHLDTRGLL